ncbi:MAG TPA: glycosyltransferase [Candidatus Limnocylindrales bacterium]|nr:glycosyltransferase [Candidatus Limnocylindrales bacterium]
MKRWIFRLLGKDPEGVVVTFFTGDRALCERMAAEVRALEPDRRHFIATEENWPQLRRELRKYRIGLAPVMLGPQHASLRRAAYRLAPRKILAYNSRLERHHLRPGLASFLFWRGVPLDRIFLRPRWWPLRQDRSVIPEGSRAWNGRPSSPDRARVAVLSPYFPYPLSHGGAVRIYNLLREIAREFDVELLAFSDSGVEPELAPLLEFCARVVLVGKPRYREPRWSSLLPPEVHEFRSPAMREAIAAERSTFGFQVLQVEYTQLAEYGGDILVEHDVTFDLFGQIARRERTAAAWWDYWRWRRFETRAIRRFRRVVVMSPKDAEMLGGEAAVLENGVDLERFQPAPEAAGQRLLFIGSFRHFPNIAAFRFFTEQVWPILRDKFPALTITVVCGADPLVYWRAFADTPEPPQDPRITMLDFVRDVRPLYNDANLVIVPTTVSAGTNVKVLEAMAMKRAVISTTSGCAGLGLLHGHSVWVADTAEAFAAGVATLINDPDRRAAMAEAAHGVAVRQFDWRAIGSRQRDLLRSVAQSTSRLTN